MCRSVYPTGGRRSISCTATRAKSRSRAAVIGYGVSLDTRTTPAGNQSLTATRRVHNVEGWRCYDHGHERDFAVLAGWCPGAATAQLAADARDTYPGRRSVAARLAVRRGLGRRLAVHRVSPARVDRACLVAGIAPVDRPRRHDVGRAAGGSKRSPPRSRNPSARTSASWCAIRPPIRPECAPRAGLLPMPGPHRRYAAHTSDISYGPGGRDNLLDIWRRHDLVPGRRAPVLIQVPGGAWALNGKRPQAYTLMSRMVELGWICVSIDYSKSPRCTFPAHIIDVKRAIAWVRENIADYGGDPDFIAITGGSAGGHLASLAALTPNDPTFQPGFERRRHHGASGGAVLRRLRLHRLREHARTDDAVPRAVRDASARYADEPERFRAASPISYVHARRAAVLRAARREG